MKINTSYSHINVLNSVLAILTDDMREGKALLKSIDEHGLSLIGAEFFFQFHIPEDKDCEEDAKDGGDCDDDDGLGKQRIEGGRSDRCQSIKNWEGSVTKVSDIEEKRAIEHGGGTRMARANGVGSKQTACQARLRVMFPIERDDSWA
jgi:hypothetical protein